MKPKFSVIIPVHNKKPHVSRSIYSVLNQTFNDFELLIIDDASTDGSYNEINSVFDSRIKIFQRDTPGPGGYAARNLGISEAEGEWIVFLDADDEWLPFYLERMNQLINVYPHDVFFSCGWMMSSGVAKSDCSYYATYKTKGDHSISLSEFLISYDKKLSPVCTDTVCLKKSIIPKNGLFPENQGAHRGGDRYAWLLLMCRYKRLVWGCFVGAIYHVDSVNMVTKSGASSSVLMSRKNLESMNQGLSAKEKRLLVGHFNQKIIYAWAENVRSGSNNFRLFGSIFLIPVTKYALLGVGLIISPTFFLKKYWDYKLK